MATLINIYTLAIMVMLAICLAMLSLVLQFRLRKNQKMTMVVIKKVAREMNAVSTGSIGLGKKMIEMEGCFRRLQKKQHQKAIHGHEQPASYQQASKLIDKGLSTEDVAKTCHIPRAEAELLESMRRMIVRNDGKSG